MFDSQDGGGARARAVGPLAQPPRCGPGCGRSDDDARPPPEGRRTSGRTQGMEVAPTCLREAGTRRNDHASAGGARGWTGGHASPVHGMAERRRGDGVPPGKAYSGAATGAPGMASPACEQQLGQRSAACATGRLSPPPSRAESPVGYNHRVSLYDTAFIRNVDLAGS